MAEADRTAFPWCPVATWQYDTRGPRPLWHVRIQDPSQFPIWLNTVHGHGPTPETALESLLGVVSWWLDYDGRRGGTVGQIYGHGQEVKDRGLLGQGPQRS